MRWNFLQSLQDRRPPAQINLFGGIANARPVLEQPWGVQESPEPVHQGSETPSRPSRWPITILTHDQKMDVQEDRFVAIIVGPQPLATVPRGRLQPDRMRANIRVPPHLAYGSLFISDAPPYGLG